MLPNIYNHSFVHNETGICSIQTKLTALVKNAKIDCMKNVFLVFAIALLLNLVWEHLHFSLYDCSSGCYISTFGLFSSISLLVKASIFDSFFITALYIFISILHRSFSWIARWNTTDTLFILAVSTTVATLIERHALASHKWTYATAMPIVPILGVGLSPFLQLAALSLATYAIVQKLLQ